MVLFSRAEGVQDYFDVGVLGYGAYPHKPKGLISSLGDKNNHGVINCLNTKQVLSPISQVQQATIRVEDRTKKVSDGAGGLVDVAVKFPVWVDEYASGGTPMLTALVAVAQELAQWCDNHPNSYPPIILHITDGVPTDSETNQLIEVASAIKELATDDGGILLFNAHTSEEVNDPIKFPTTSSNLPNQYSEALFEMSSGLPKQLIDAANEFYSGAVKENAKGFLFNANAEDIIQFLDIGTRTTQSIGEQQV